jgi:YHS domain-containing protein
MLGAPVNPPGDIQRVSRLGQDVVFFHWTALASFPGPRTTEGGVMATVTDPVCGMEIDSAAAAASEEYGGKTYYFCSEACHQQFVAAPEQYAV